MRHLLKLTCLLLACASSPFATAGVDVPLKASLTVDKDAILCTSSESLFLLYEGAYLASKSGGKEAFEGYFKNAATTLETAGVCTLNTDALPVEIVGFDVFTNAAKANAGQRFYGAFELLKSRRLVYVNADSVPGLMAQISQLAKSASQKQ